MNTGFLVSTAKQSLGVNLGLVIVVVAMRMTIEYAIFTTNMHVIA